MNKDLFKLPSRALSVFLMGLIFMYDEILLRIFTETGLFGNLLYPLLFGIAGGLLCTGVALLLPKKAETVLRCLILIVTGAFFTTEALIHSSFQQFYSLNEILFGTGGVVADFGSDVISAIVSGIPQIVLFMLPPVLYTFFLRKKLMPVRRGRRWIGAEAIALSLVLTLLGVFFVNIGADSDLYGGNYAFTASAQTFGLFTSLRLEQKFNLFGNKAAASFVMLDNAATETEEVNAVTGVDPTTVKVEGNNEIDINFKELLVQDVNTEYEDLDTYCMVTKPTAKNAYTGLFKGKNLILITAEAFSDIVVDPSLTPTLYRLIHNGFYLSDAYQPGWGGSTSSGEFSVIMGLAPENVESMKKSANNNNYYTMGTRLAAEGYYSVAFHNGTTTFYDRNITHMNLGYSDYMAVKSGLNDLTGDHPTDEAMFDVTLELCMNKQPFNLYYMTVSGHAGYYNSQDSRVLKYADRVRAFLGDKYSEHNFNYFCYQMMLEDALATMVSRLESAGIADDTVIAMCTDHYPYGLAKSKTFKNDVDYLVEFYGENYQPWQRDKTSIILWSGALEHDLKNMQCEVTKPVSSIDMLPTLLNLFGVEFDSRLLAGRDIFSDEEGIVYWNNSSWVTERCIYNKATKEYTPRKGYELDDEYNKRIAGIVKNRLSFSRMVVDTDYYGHLFGRSATQGGTLDARETDHSHILAGVGMVSQRTDTASSGGEEAPLIDEEELLLEE